MKKIIYVSIAMYSCGVFAGEWISDVDTKCQVWSRTSSTEGKSISIKWSGLCENNKANGKGILQWYVNGKLISRYEGDLLDGYINGKGVSIWTNGLKYDGEWKNNVQSGYGERTVTKNGKLTETFKGEFENGDPSGFGVITNESNGKTVKGLWRNGKFYVECQSKELCMEHVSPQEKVGAEDDAQLMASGQWRDPKTNLIWMRCIFGQKWVDGKCIGSESKMSFKDAVLSIDTFEFGGNSDWRIPTHGEMLTITEEKIGRYNIKYIQGYKYKNVFFPSSARFSRGRFEGEEYGEFINLTNNLNFGSTDPEQGYGDVSPYDLKNHDAALIRAVRSSNSSGAFEVAVSEIRQADEQKKQADEQARLRDIKEAEEAAEREKERQVRLKVEEKERQARFKKEAALSAQSMYLQAGKYDRSGQQSDAIRLYELLIEKFPSSPLAVQATNRLVAIQADEKVSNSSKPSNTECSHLYIGKAVSYKGCGALWCTTVEGVITGIGDGVATMRVTGSEYNGDVIEKSCSKF